MAAKPDDSETPQPEDSEAPKDSETPGSEEPEKPKYSLCGEGFDLRSMSVDPLHYVNRPLREDEYVLECPYDTSHRIRPQKLPHHLYRCRRNHAKARQDLGLPPEELVQCEFERGHWIQPMEVEFHRRQCSFKDRPPEKEFSFLKYAPVNPPDPEYEKRMEEDPEYQEWKPDPNYRSYSPTRHLRETPVYYTPSLMTKAEKKQFYKLRVEKFRRLCVGPPWVVSTGNTPPPSPNHIYVDPEFTNNPEYAEFDFPPYPPVPSSSSSAAASSSSSAAAAPPPPEPEQPTEDEHIVFVSNIKDLQDSDSKDRK